MMRDLYSDLPDEETEQGNYATRLARRWIECDPSLMDRCQDCVRDLAEDRQDPVVIVRELRALVVAEALLTETTGLFADLFTRDCHEIDWSVIAATFLDIVVAEFL